jgi:sugar O-acyltransferase (sialic acid O-acetyltransferase NeuD family)
VKKKLYIFGAKNLAEMAHYLFTTDSPYEVAGFTVDGQYLKEGTFQGLPVVAYEELRAGADRAAVEVFVAIGIAKVNKLRAQKVAAVQADGFRLASFVSSHARVPKDLVARPNTLIMEQVWIGPHTDIGSDVVIWSGTRIALKVKIADHVWITSAAVGESTTVGERTFIGLNATISPFIKVGADNLIGAGTLIMKDTQDGEIYKAQRTRASKVPVSRIENLGLIS